jgi:hypothetical protein
MSDLIQDQAISRCIHFFLSLTKLARKAAAVDAQSIHLKFDEFLRSAIFDLIHSKQYLSRGRLHT